MSVFLTILKIIGIVLLVILCIILALLLIVLFVPFRYEAHVVKNEPPDGGSAINGIYAKAGVTWLLHLITFRIIFENGKLQKGLRILGIDLSKKKKEKEKKKKKKVPKEGPERPLSEIAEDGKKKKKAGQDQDLLTDDDLEDEDFEDDDVLAESVGKEQLTETVSEPEEDSGKTEAADAAEASETAGKEEAPGEAETEKPAESEEASGDTSGENKAEEASGTEEAAGTEEPEAKAEQRKKVRKINDKKARTFTDFLWLVAEKVYNVIKKIVTKIKGIIAKIKAVHAKIKHWTDFLQDERTQAAIVLALKEVGGILKSMLPKKIIGFVHYGSGDPCKTGQQLAYLAAAYPLYGKSLSIYPDFEEKVLEGDIELKGRLFIATIVWAGIKLILNKNIKYVIGFVRNKEDNTNGGE